MTTKEKALRLEAKANQVSAELSAIDYAIYLVDEKRKSAADMVQNVPQNIYIEDWKRELNHNADKLRHLERIKVELQIKLRHICKEWDKAENELVKQ